MRVARRDVPAAAVAGTRLGLAGARGRTPPSVVGAGHELATSRRVPRGDPEPVEVVSAGDGIGAPIRARQRAGSGPDVATTRGRLGG